MSTQHPPARDTTEVDWASDGGHTDPAAPPPHAEEDADEEEEEQ